MGRCAFTQDILQLLINRLHIQRDREEWPRKFAAPLFNNGTAAHRDRTSSESGGDSPISWTLVKTPR